MSGGVSSDYPLVAPNYAQRRSALAREIGLGRKISAATGEGKKDSARGRRTKKED